MEKKELSINVLRITVDEMLSEDLFRLEICKLIKTDKSGEFKDEPEYWQDIYDKDGEEVMVRPDKPAKNSTSTIRSYVERMSIPNAKLKQYPWKELKEGQVYLSGEFEIRTEKPGKKPIKQYFTSANKRAFERIDDDVYENTKTLYYKVLANKEKNG